MGMTHECCRFIRSRQHARVGSRAFEAQEQALKALPVFDGFQPFVSLHSRRLCTSTNRQTPPTLPVNAAVRNGSQSRYPVQLHLHPNRTAPDLRSSHRSGRW